MIHHGEFLRSHTRDDKLVYHISRDHKLAELEEAEQAMMAFAYKLNFEPGKVALGDVDALRDAGFDDRAVLDIVLVISMFNFMNRLADGLGVIPNEPFVKAKARADARVEAEIAKPPEALAGK